ncbi:MAG: hypothetical protein B6I20_14505 [Bacteroidetes bacterium 4572_117]|nr:MAG: hypothetical protein B6I20_14505 [Bacteroidetes bacterium 4572_117]
MKTTLPESARNIKPLIETLKNKLQKLYGDNMLQIILFGSYAHGNVHDESDIDLLLILNKMKSPYHENVFMNEVVSDFSLASEIYFSVIATTKKQFNFMKNPLYQNINKEGIII